MADVHPIIERVEKLLSRECGLYVSVPTFEAVEYVVRPSFQPIARAVVLDTLAMELSEETITAAVKAVIDMGGWVSRPVVMTILRAMLTQLKAEVEAS